MNILEKVNIVILLVTISYIMALSNLLAGLDQIEPQMRWLITFFTSVGLFRLLILLIHWLIRSSDALLALYHRTRFLKGLWTYSYDVNGQRHYGIWRIAQDVASLSITGYGVDADGKMDSHFRSISQVFEHQGVDEIMFARTDIASGDEHYSKSTLYIDPFSRRSWLSGPTDIRAQSVLYGSNEDGVRHAELVLRRADKGLSEAEIVEKLKTEAQNSRQTPVDDA
ncbi:hypothetical protein [Cognatiyoonia sp. IB215182]|uniref:hypothetical protein n=1 Tax=Cognatiyoonia sp. IB215182 TaxID=3097353 RepID=UPI002A0EB0F2|nr:hypothetical protein [Cognatiyoonia sp. IB215182]MDX8351023.1 hypothetical protein [Cognatiyoonia sp. IB215182]